MQTQDFEGTPGANFTAVRMTRDISNTVSAGAFYFGRESTGGDRFNRVTGLDVRVSPRRTLEIEAFAMRSQTAGEASDWSGRTGFQLDTNAHRARAGLVHIGDAFRHDLGYVRRRGIGLAFGNYQRILRPGDPNSRVRRSLTRVGNLSYRLLFRDGATLTTTATSTYERLDQPFGIGSDLRIPPGEYAFEDVEIEYLSNQSARISGGLGVQAGEFWTGRQRVGTGSLRIRLNVNVAASASFTRTDVELPQGSFAANLVRLRLDWSFTPRMFLNALEFVPAMLIGLHTTTQVKCSWFGRVAEAQNIRVQAPRVRLPDVERRIGHSPAIGRRRDCT